VCIVFDLGLSLFQLVVDNGIVSVKFSRPEGYILQMSYKGINNILADENEEQDRGYLPTSQQIQLYQVWHKVKGTNASYLFLGTWTWFGIRQESLVIFKGIILRLLHYYHV